MNKRRRFYKRFRPANLPRTNFLTMWADGNPYVTLRASDNRRRINALKCKYGIPQRYALYVHVKKDGSKEYGRFAKDKKKFYLVVKNDMLIDEGSE